MLLRRLEVRLGRRVTGGKTQEMSVLFQLESVRSDEAARTPTNVEIDEKVQCRQTEKRDEELHERGGDEIRKVLFERCIAGLILIWITAG